MRGMRRRNGRGRRRDGGRRGELRRRGREGRRRGGIERCGRGCLGMVGVARVRVRVVKGRLWKGRARCRSSEEGQESAAAAVLEDSQAMEADEVAEPMRTAEAAQHQLLRLRQLSRVLPEACCTTRRILPNLAQCSFSGASRTVVNSLLLRDRMRSMCGSLVGLMEVEEVVLGLLREGEVGWGRREDGGLEVISQKQDRHRVMVLKLSGCPGSCRA